jgi:hypothetical protein
MTNLRQSIRAIAVGCCLWPMGCSGLEAENTLEAQEALGAVGSELRHASASPVEHLSSAWIPDIANGNIVSAWTSNGQPYYSYMPGTSWHSAPVPPAGAFSASATTAGYAWPQPDNVCDVYVCSGSGPVLSYVSAHSVLATGFLGDTWSGNTRGTAAIVATTATGSGFGEYDVVVVTSVDGGEHFTRAHILSDGISGTGQYLEPDSVYASVLVTPEDSAREQTGFSAPIYVVWKGGLLTPSWWVTKILVEPLTGEVVVLNKPREMVTEVNPEASTVTLQAFQGHDGRETVTLVSSIRRDPTTLAALSNLPSCPTDDNIRVEWQYAQVRGFWHEDGPTFTVPTATIAEDLAWRPCVGPSHNPPSPNFSSLYANSDRAALATHRADAEFSLPKDPIIEHIAFAKSDPAAGGRSRIYQIVGRYRRLSSSTAWTTTSGFLPAASATAEEYLPELRIHQGARFDFKAQPNNSAAATSALIRKSVDGNQVNIRGRAYQFAWDEGFLAGGNEWKLPKTPGEVDLTSAWTPAAVEGRSLGLTMFQNCVRDYFGPCPATNPVIDPLDVFFYGAWARSNGSGAPGIFGRKFEN